MKKDYQKRALARGRKEVGMCQTCKRIGEVIVTETGDGWVSVMCEAGHVRIYRRTGHPN